MSGTPHLSIYDSTLRDGAQSEGICLSTEDKLRVAQRLDSLGVRYIEGGFPGSNPHDENFFRVAQTLNLQHAKLVAFGATCRGERYPEEDEGLRALQAARTPVCALIGKSSAFHVQRVLGVPYDENLRLIEESVNWLCHQGREVIFDAEHFFDGCATDTEYALATVEAAVRGGARTVVLCDTNGGAAPWQVADMVERVITRAQHWPEFQVGIHAHNDGGCAVANSMAAVQAGATHVQGTINGYGERCGSADLCTLIPNLELKLRRRCLPEGNLKSMASIAHSVAEVANRPLDGHAPFVGRNAFVHKGGSHISAVRREPSSYQHINPAHVGNVSQGLDVVPQGTAAGSPTVANASVTLGLRRRSRDYQPPFVVEDYKISTGRPTGLDDAHAGTHAEVEVTVAGDRTRARGSGSGPVEALDAALREAFRPQFANLERIHLTDYKVQVVKGRCGTQASAQVLIDSSDGDTGWTTVGASVSIIEASCLALLDSYEYSILQSQAAPQPQRRSSAQA